MKAKTKALVLALCAVLLVVTTVFATMAFLTSEATVTNTFTVGNVTITLDEAKVNLDGTAVAGADRVTENTYKLIPGHAYLKDPTVHVDADSEDCWLFVKVENGLSAIEGGTTIASQMAAKGWTLVSGTTDVYAYRSTVSAGTNVSVFDSFTVAGNADVSAYSSAMIVVTAYAVQADGFATAAAAWTATFGA